MGRKKEKALSKTVTLVDSIENLQKMEDTRFLQGNPLIEAIFVQPFNELDLKVLCLVSKYINENKFSSEKGDYIDATEKFLKVIVPKEDFCYLLQTNPLNFHKQMEILMKTLMEKHIIVKSKVDGKRKKEGFCLFPYVACDNGNAIFGISPILRPYLRHLKNNFTVLSLEYIAKMNSCYAIKIYKLLKQYEKIGKREFDIQELKNTLGISNLYDKFGNFEKNVLEIAKKNINEFSDLKVNFHANKVGRKIDSITFNINKKQTQFQQAINIFKKEMDFMVLITERRKIGYPYDTKHHKKTKEIWEEANKRQIWNYPDILSLFEIWKNEAVTSYDEKSFEKLQFEATDEIKWYENWLVSQEEKDRKQRFVEIIEESKRINKEYDKELETNI